MPGRPAQPNTARVLLAVVAAIALAGCASMHDLDSEVNSYSHWPADRAPSTYSFERLPSQEADPAGQSMLESAARPAFARNGLKEVGAGEKADVKVQVGLRSARDESYGWDDPFWPGGMWAGRGMGWNRGWGGGWSPSLAMSYRSPRYEHEIVVLIRDTANGNPLYETRASYDSYGGSDSTTLSALFDAAMRDFPKPTISPRRVTVPIHPPVVPAPEAASAPKA